MYFKMVMSNGFCGCEEEEYVELNNEKEANEYLDECIASYSFFEPDSRFVNEDDYNSYEEYEADVEYYQDGIYEYSYFEEITEEEYNENKEEE